MRCTAIRFTVTLPRTDKLHGLDVHRRRKASGQLEDAVRAGQQVAREMGFNATRSRSMRVAPAVSPMQNPLRLETTVLLGIVGDPSRSFRKRHRRSHRRGEGHLREYPDDRGVDQFPGLARASSFRSSGPYPPRFSS